MFVFKGEHFVVYRGLGNGGEEHMGQKSLLLRVGGQAKSKGGSSLER